MGSRPIAVRRGVPYAGLRHERLDLDEEGPASFKGDRDDAPRGRHLVLDEEGAGRIRDLAQAGLDHLEDADLVGCAEPVLRGPDQAKGAAALALDGDHGVDQVLEGLGPGDAAVLGDVTDEDHHDPLPLGQLHEAQRRLAHLPHAARRAVQLLEGRGLDRVDDDRGRPHARGRSPR